MPEKTSRSRVPIIASMTASFVIVAVVAAGCSSSKNNSSAPPASSTAPSSTAASGSPDMAPAATLRAALTAMLNDHVWLAGNALDTAIRAKGNLKDPAVQGAVAALDGNSVALSKAIGSVYPSAEKPFLDSWRTHIGYFVNYTLGKATKDDAKVAQAKKDLDGYRTAFGQLIHSVIPGLSASAVADELKPHVQTLLDAIDADVAGSPDFQTKLETAAAHMSMTADVLAGAIAKDKGLAGSVDGSAATVLSTLTAQLNDHVWLAGNALDTAVVNGGDLKNAAVMGAVAALDANSVALSKTVGSVYPTAEKPFLDSWRTHIGFFVNYTLGKATKNAAMVAKAKSDLAGYAVSFGQLLHSVIAGLPASAVESELQAHVTSLLAAIDAAVAGAPDYQSKLAVAATHMPHTAAALTGAIVADKHIAT